MKNKKVFLIYCTIFLLFSGCGKSNNLNYNLPLPGSKISVLKNTGEGLTISELKKDKLIDGKNIQNISDLSYSSKNKIGAFVIGITHGNTFTHNKIVIENNTKIEELKKFYSCQDMKMSPGGENIAYRSFSKDDYSGAEGIKIYNIKRSKYINIKSDILISGSLYQWLNDKEIIYYGVPTDGKVSGKIYKYSLSNNSESIYFDNIEGFCTSFIAYSNKGLLFLEQDMNEDRLCYFDFTCNKKILLSNDITDIDAYSINRSVNEIYMICKNDNDNSASIYRFSVEKKTFERLTYDFPENVDKDGGIAIDENGTAYFLGNLDSDTSKDSLFSYKSSDKSINLVLNYNNSMHIFQDSQNK